MIHTEGQDSGRAFFLKGKGVVLSAMRYIAGCRGGRKAYFAAREKGHGAGRLLPGNPEIQKGDAV